MIGVVIVAGGIGKRMGAPLPKQFLPLKNRSIAQRSIDLFLSLERISELVVVCSPGYQPMIETDSRIRFAEPGRRRQDSVANGVAALSPAISLVAIHDAVRPLVEREVVVRALTEAQQHGASVVAAPIVSTVKRSNGDGFISASVDRSALWEIQTPQVVDRSLLEAAFRQAHEEGWEVTDDISLVERLGHPVKIVEGCRRNLKITTPADLALAEKLFEAPCATA